MSKVPDRAKQVFDLIAIGTGVAASTVVHKCRSVGWSVAIIDSRPFGGTCALRGCDPKKVLVGAAEAVDLMQRMKGKGVSANSRINWPELMQFKKSFTDPVPESREKSFRKAGITTFHGIAHFTGPKTIHLGEISIEGRHILIATGAKPMKLGIPGEQYLTKSDEFLKLEKLPSRIVFVGGGYISFEFAHVAARAGAKVTIIHRGKKPLEKFDPDLVDMLMERTRNLGVDVQLQTEVKEIKKHDGSSDERRYSVRVEVGAESKEEKSIEAGLIVHGAGRTPEIEDLDPNKADIEFGKKGVTVNEYLQSVSNPAVYAAGDADDREGGLPLTPVASYDGEVVATNLIEGNSTKADFNGTPSVVFTIPPLASVGMQEKSAKESGVKCRINHSNTAEWYSSRRTNETYSGYKILIDEDSGRILGAHLLGPNADEVINIFAMAIKFGLTADDLKKVLWSYPTNASDIVYML